MDKDDEKAEISSGVLPATVSVGIKKHLRLDK